MQQALQQCWQQLEQNRPDVALAALTHFDRSYRDHENRLVLQAALEAMTTVECWLGRLSVAERQAKRAIARANEVDGELSVASMRALLTLARVYWRQSREAEASTLVARAVQLPAPTIELESWQWAHQCLGMIRGGEYRQALDAWGVVNALQRSIHPERHRNVLALSLLRCRLARLLGQNDVAGLLLNTLGEPLQSCPQQLPLYFSERALFALELQRWEEAVQWAGQACRASEQLPNFCRLGSARLFELLARGHMELEQAEVALAVLERAEQSLHWPQETLAGEGYVGTVLWPEDELSEEGESPQWPLLWPGWSHQEEVQTWLDLAGRKARLLRRLGREEEARVVAGAAKAVRSSHGEARLGRHKLMQGDTITVRATFLAPGRRPRRIGWESARGEMEWLGDGREGKLLALFGAQRDLLRCDSTLFADILPLERVELYLYARDARSSTKSAIPYTVWVQFTSGPPLRLPILV